MGKLIYAALASLDGYVADQAGSFEWAAPDEEVHAYVNEMERPVGTYLYGRRMYETMVYWKDPDAFAEEPAVIQDYAQIWQAAEKIVYSRTLEAPVSERTELRREFDPEAIRGLKRDTPDPISIGGAELAGQALAAGLVDECHLILAPVLVGGGKRALPEGVQTRLTLTGERSFANGMVHLGYAVDG